MFKKMFIIVAIFGSLSIIACRSVPMASPEQDAEAKTFKPNPNGAKIYIYRNELFGGAIKIDLNLDGQLVGRTIPNSFMLLNVTAGNHNLMSESENKSNLSIDAEKGKIYFVWQEAKMGLWLIRNKLQIVNERIGQEGVNECKLIQQIKE